MSEGNRQKAGFLNNPDIPAIETLLASFVDNSRVEKESVSRMGREGEVHHHIRLRWQGPVDNVFVGLGRHIDLQQFSIEKLARVVRIEALAG